MQALKRILVFLAFSLVSCFLVLLVFGIVTEGQEEASAIWALLIVGVPIAVGMFAAFKIFPFTEAERARIEDRKAKKAEQKKANAEAPNAMSKLTRKCTLQLVDGLGLPAGSKCKTVYNSSRIVFTASGQTFSLDGSKIIDVSVSTAAEIKKQYVSSAGGAIAGALIAGPLGAIVGGSATKKNVRSNTSLLIITYLSEGGTKYIVFDVTAHPGIGTGVASTFKHLKKKDNLSVEL